MAVPPVAELPRDGIYRCSRGGDWHDSDYTHCAWPGFLFLHSVSDYNSTWIGVVVVVLV